MAEPLRVEAPTADLAHALMERLKAFPTQLMENGVCEVSVTLVGNPDRAVTDVLHMVDEWLVDNDLGRVRVHLHAHTYTLNQPQPG